MMAESSKSGQLRAEWQASQTIGISIIIEITKAFLCYPERSKIKSVLLRNCKVLFLIFLLETAVCTVHTALRLFCKKYTRVFWVL